MEAPKVMGPGALSALPMTSDRQHGGFLKIGLPLQSSILVGFSHYKPSILGYPQSDSSCLLAHSTKGPKQLMTKHGAVVGTIENGRRPQGHQFPVIQRIFACLAKAMLYACETCRI